MRILFLNRRDIKNPDGGGAEIYTHEIAKGLVERYNCRVSGFSNLFFSGEKEEMIDGVQYIRKGSEFTVHLWGFIYAVRHRKELDLIVDEFNGMGFFTFFLRNSILLIHQLYKRFWLRELGLFGVFPYLFEPVILKLYKNKKTITVSNSTKKDLEGLGFKQVHIVMNALRTKPLDTVPEKGEVPTMVFLGRLRSTKGPGNAIEIFKRVRDEIDNAQLWIIGSGPEEPPLKKKAAKMSGITFWGHINDEKKMELLKRAHILLVPGIREGFGINVIEAASVGTPSIGYNIHGLRDSIIHGETGFLVNDMNSAVEVALELLSKKDFYQKMSQDCIKYAENFSWDKRIEEFWAKISGYKNKR